MEKYIEKTIKDLWDDLKVKVNLKEEKFHGKNVPNFKAIVTIDGVENVFYAECKTELRNIHIPKLLELKKNYLNLLVITDKYYPNIVNTLIENNIGYIGADGTVNLNAKGIRIYKPGTKQKPKDNTLKNKYTPAGLKIIFNLLNYDGFVNFTHREMANICNTALGNVNKIIGKLKDENFLIKLNNNKLKPNNTNGLFKIWTEQYNDILKPKLLIGKYRFIEIKNIQNWKNIDLGFKNYWGGETAGAIITNYLKPAVHTLYTDEVRNNLIKHFKIIPQDNNFDLLIYKKFWHENQNHENITPYLLVYTDLINTKDSRNIETAQLIYDKYLKEKFQ